MKRKAQDCKQRRRQRREDEKLKSPGNIHYHERDCARAKTIRADKQRDWGEDYDGS